MLKGISPFIGPELLATLSRMGHGDEIVLADAHFPGESLGPAVIRADGVQINDLLSGVLPLFELDAYVDDPVVMMQVVKGDSGDPAIEKGYGKIIKALAPHCPPLSRIDRFDFYDRAKKAFAIVMSGDTHKYANIILKKGVTPVVR
ncbi:MAG: L-fucose mutarotase [Chitinivibrionales bacterium]|nr:L-fucose mutarotase [Chitinivibrionales bacterium]